jgi:ParB family transcriptional regulator, chromosome partitioning protein
MAHWRFMIGVEAAPLDVPRETCQNTAMTNDTSSKNPKRRLGRGLSSLVSTPVTIDSPAPEDGPQVQMIAVEAIRPNTRQPRQHFDQQALQSLAESIRTAGMMQPLVIRPDPAGGYQLIAGERRWRAAQLVDMAKVPAIVRDVDDREAAEFALIENLQREDLNPLERAEAFARLISDFALTHQEVAERVGLDRSNVTNHLRLLDLDEEFKDALRQRKIGMGHARALLAITNMEQRRALGHECIAAGWSVREIDRRARRASAQSEETPVARPATRQLHMKDLERQLSEHLGTKVELRPGKAKGSGRLIISFFTFEEFDGLLERLRFDSSAR